MRTKNSLARGQAALPDATRTLAQIESLDWRNIADGLNRSGLALLKAVLTPRDCEALKSLYAGDQGFRSRVVMSRHGFGRGEYKYFSYSLPAILQELRTSLYEKASPDCEPMESTDGHRHSIPSDAL